jgi:hypothetical protein
MKYHVMCKVSGGVTGTRQALLKANGVVQEFDSFEEADAEAGRLNAKMNHQWSVAYFEYWAVEAEPVWS